MTQRVLYLCQALAMSVLLAACAGVPRVEELIGASDAAVEATPAAAVAQEPAAPEPTAAEAAPPASPRAANVGGKDVPGGPGTIAKIERSCSAGS